MRNRLRIFQPLSKMAFSRDINNDDLDWSSPEAYYEGRSHIIQLSMWELSHCSRRRVSIFILSPPLNENDETVILLKRPGIHETATPELQWMYLG